MTFVLRDHFFNWFSPAIASRMSRYPFIIDQFCASVIGSKARMISFAVFPDSPRESIPDSDIENRVVPVCDDVDPKVVVARHGLKVYIERFLEFARNDIIG
jgi:hypothetical protein